MSKGPYKYSEVTGSKCMSSAKGPLKNGTGKMSSAHGQHGGSKSHNMNQGGGNKIGKGTRTFKHEAYPSAGPKRSYPGHASQPSGHKSKN